MYGGYSGSMDDVLIVLGGRAINHMQVDRQIGAEMAAMVHTVFFTTENVLHMCDRTVLKTSLQTPVQSLQYSHLVITRHSVD